MMPYFPLSSLDRVYKLPEFTPPILLKILLDTAEGMRYLAEHNVLHRDLKPQNIVV